MLSSDGTEGGADARAAVAPGGSSAAPDAAAGARHPRADASPPPSAWAGGAQPRRGDDRGIARRKGAQQATTRTYSQPRLIVYGYLLFGVFSFVSQVQNKLHPYPARVAFQPDVHRVTLGHDAP